MGRVGIWRHWDLGLLGLEGLGRVGTWGVVIWILGFGDMVLRFEGVRLVVGYWDLGRVRSLGMQCGGCWAMGVLRGWDVGALGWGCVGVLGCQCLPPSCGTWLIAG